MDIWRYDQEAPDGLVKCLYVDVGKFRLFFALSESAWYTKGKKRLIPIWIKDKSLFIYKLAMRIGTVSGSRMKHYYKENTEE
ncbi:hypothetical protein [Oceanobacillus profundus]|uniref:Uncharacterized protein n=1 Tax=Oceanobacillus profundus TaxID=372463 RepID=A0A417YGC7_9BACI|nr:hypothetical protein [Oceanobacillus profundus]RHW31878.1 hypothetical protein D1B32_11610 [Oceanobacillus profundus]